LGEKLKDVLTWVEKGIVALNGNASFQEVNAELGEYCLPVEPLSAKKTISQFIKEGGIGYNSLQNGTVGSKIYQLSSSFDEIKFTYGSKYKTLYNSGYPLHRIIEGPLFSEELSNKFDQIEIITLPVKSRKKIEVSFRNITIDQLHIPDYASNVFYLNNFGARLMGFEGQGMVTTCRDRIDTNNILENEVWGKRFFEDQIPVDHDTLKFFTMKSRSELIYHIFNETLEGLFVALCVHNGILLLMSGKRRQLDEVGGKIRQIPLTFELGR
jgi:hypothetical protein